ncbi:MAG: fructose,6-bisphosphatase / sedoheptulose,7-bisphosphatase [Sphingomonadales bacterium]|nr:fructose,6-bisphosphatase / sedoheptulose,7-bisphosphatase [Sphingomonadales bacterium]
MRPSDQPIDRVLTLEVLRVTERAAIAAALVRGRGDEKLADQAAVYAMHTELNRLAVSGRVVIGEGERGEAPMLYIGEEVGTGDGPDVDIALDPLEGTTICAKNLPNSLAVIAVTHRGSLLNVPDLYMEKIAIGPGYPAGLVDLDMAPDEAIRRLAHAKGVRPRDISACILDRPRHAGTIAAVRSTEASIRLIGDGDVAGIIHTTDPEVTGIDIYLGRGGAPEGVLAAAALRCIGGQMCGRLIVDSDAKRARVERMGITDPGRVYSAPDMASGDVLFAATGVTDGSLLDGVGFHAGIATTHSIVTRSHTGTQRWVKTRHRIGDKFGFID